MTCKDCIQMINPPLWAVELIHHSEQPRRPGGEREAMDIIHLSMDSSSSPSVRLDWLLATIEYQQKQLEEMILTTNNNNISTKDRDNNNNNKKNTTTTTTNSVPTQENNLFRK